MVDLHWDGFEEFKDALQHLPTELAQEAGRVVVAAAEDTAQATSAAYPVRTGNLARRVKVVVHDGTSNGIASAIVVSAAPHSHLYELGTQQRHTRQGWNRGRMPQGPESQRLVPRAIRTRKKMIDQLKQVVADAGFQVAET